MNGACDDASMQTGPDFSVTCLTRSGKQSAVPELAVTGDFVGEQIAVRRAAITTRLRHNHFKDRSRLDSRDEATEQV